MTLKFKSKDDSSDILVKLVTTKEGVLIKTCPGDQNLILITNGTLEYLFTHGKTESVICKYLKPELGGNFAV